MLCIAACSLLDSCDTVSVVPSILHCQTDTRCVIVGVFIKVFKLRVRCVCVHGVVVAAVQRSLIRFLWCETLHYVSMLPVERLKSV